MSTLPHGNQSAGCPPYTLQHVVYRALLLLSHHGTLTGVLHIVVSAADTDFQSSAWQLLALQLHATQSGVH